MKTKITRYSRLLAMSAIALVTLYACEKDDDKDEPRDYVGQWVTVRTVQSEDGDFEVQDIVNFTESGFTEIASIVDPITEEWVDLIGRKGEFTVKSGLMNVKLTEAGFSELDDDTGLPTGDIIYYEEGTDEFDALLEELDMIASYKAKYTISGDNLTLKSDNNNNGSYDDDDEVYTFTRVD